MSVMSKSTTNLGPQMRISKLSLEKKAWFMFKVLCEDLSGATFAQMRSVLDRCSGIKTRVKLNHKGWRVGSKMSLNPKVQYEFYPFNLIWRIIQDVHYINVLFLVLYVDAEESDVKNSYEVLAYKFKHQSSAFRFQETFYKLCSSMDKTLNRTELSLGSLALVPARRYPMGPLAVDRWGGPQGPRSEVSYGRGGYGFNHYQNGRLLKSSLAPPRAHDDPSDLGSYDSSDNATTTYRDVAVSANVHTYTNHSEGRGVKGEEVDWNGEVTAEVDPRNFHGSTILSDDSRLAASSVDDSGFYGGHEVAVAHVPGPQVGGANDVIDGTVSVRKIFSKQTRNGTSSKGSSVNPDEHYYRYNNLQAPSMGSKSRSIDHLEHNGRTFRTRPVQYQQVQFPASGGPSRLDFRDNASEVSQGSVYLLNPRFRRTYLSRNGGQHGRESVYSNRLIGQY